ncbi:MAG: heavy metal sensor histidine kinase [Betaproteobacteria bacterium]|nr:MAG: heavy metal sensor histidine kinase [Betaproteobacteria bacterium]
MIRSLSLTARLTLLFAALTASLLIAAGIVLGRALDAHFRELDLHELHGKLTLIRNLLEHRTAETTPSDLFVRLDDSFVGHDSVGVLLRGSDGQVLHVIRREHFDDALLAGTPPTEGVRQWSVGGRPHIGLAAGVALPTDGSRQQDVQLLIALDPSHHSQFLVSVRRVLWAGIALGALLAGFVGWFAAHRGLAPLRRVSATARDLSAQRLDERLHEGDAPPEVRELVDAFNAMLERLQAAFQRLADSSADIAHELRTPISNLMTQTAVALSKPRSADEYRDVLASNLEEYERIARMVGDMLFLAKAEENSLAHDNELIDLTDEARALADFYEALAEEHGVHIVCHGHARVRGDRLMLRRALSNLLSNALRHTPEGGRIEIAIEALESQVKLAVRNIGDPIQPDQLERIFERFHRGSDKRERHGEGAGLGLAITRSIVRAHGGEIAADSSHGVTTFTITLPLPPDGQQAS